jgi:hypothetical protein
MMQRYGYNGFGAEPTAQEIREQQIKQVAASACAQSQAATGSNENLSIRAGALSQFAGSERQMAAQMMIASGCRGDLVARAVERANAAGSTSANLTPLWIGLGVTGALVVGGVIFYFATRKA